MVLGERKKEILRTIVEQYVETAEPIGSKVIAQNIGISASPATIRNDMAELESLGLLEQPHTSSGRIPTAQGYRVYVNELMRRQKLSLEETETINRALNARISELDKTLSDIGKVASLITSYPAYALTSGGAAVITRFDLIFVDSNTFIVVAMLTGDTVKNKLVHSIASVKKEFLVKLGAVFNANFTNITDEKITETLILTAERSVNDKTGCVAIVASFAIEVLIDARQQRAHITGASNLFDLPEYREAPKAQRLLRYLSDDAELLSLPTPESDGNVKITIGPENMAEELKDSSVVVARQDIGSDMQVMVGIVGPTRMDYSKVTSKLTYIAKGLSLMLSGSEPDIPQIGDK